MEKNLKTIYSITVISIFLKKLKWRGCEVDNTYLKGELLIYIHVKKSFRMKNREAKRLKKRDQSIKLKSNCRSHVIGENAFTKVVSCRAN